jgi:hypothetical protein
MTNIVIDVFAYHKINTRLIRLHGSPSHVDAFPKKLVNVLIR